MSASMFEHGLGKDCWCNPVVINVPARKPAIGEIVHYKLGEHEASSINQSRTDATVASRELGLPKTRSGNSLNAGDIYPAMIVRVWNEATTTVQLQVFLDGNDTYWATSRSQGDGESQWSYPSA